MNSRDLISKRHGRAAALALVAILALASLGQTIFFVAQAGAMISVVIASNTTTRGWIAKNTAVTAVVVTGAASATAVAWKAEASKSKWAVRKGAA